MVYFRYFLEWVITFFVIWGLTWLSLLFLRKRCNPITSVICSFLFVGSTVFIIAPYLLSFPNPSVIYLPFIIFWLVFNLVRANREMG